MRRNRIVFVATGKSGLGHHRRVASVARAILERRPGTAFVLVTNAEPDGLPPDEREVFGDIAQCDRAGMAALLANRREDFAVCDTVCLPGIEHFPGTRVLILRETPAHRLARFRMASGPGWDRVIVPNPPDHWMPCDPCLSRSIEAAGWIVRPTGPRGPDDAPAGIVVATGGGGTEETRAGLYPLLERLIAAVRARLHHTIRVRQALAPRAVGAALVEADEVFDPGGDLNAVFRAADLVISTAGYNSVLELATTDTPALLMPIPRSHDDQAARVRLWGPRLGYGYDPADPEAAASWLSGEMAVSARRAPVDLGPDGAARAAELILELM
jgi:predicted glycosyltransferase